jgi:transcriptional regulator with XRE-family HTH domain
MSPEQSHPLAVRLRQLREGDGGRRRLTQEELALALSQDQPLTAATISSWETRTSPKKPPLDRLRAYARFFATERSLDGEPHLIPDGDLDPDETADMERLLQELKGLRDGGETPPAEAARPTGRRTWRFTDGGPITMICPDIPEDGTNELRHPGHPNYTDLLNYGDVDALIELHGHIRAENPSAKVTFRRASRVEPDDLTGHLILIGGVGWNDITERMLKILAQLPIRQFEHPDLKTGDVFEVTAHKPPRQYFPQWNPGPNRQLIEDVALFVRLPNPNNSSRTLTLCNGIHSRGVLGAVRLLTDAEMREANESYLAAHFSPDRGFALLLRVTVITGRTLTPDLQQAHFRLFEWSAEETA